MHIVVVDPSRITLKCIGRLLDVRHHHQYPFTDSGDALACITRNPNIDGAIVSAEQTCGSGIELCWQVRLLASHYRPIYVILMSSHDKRRILVKALDAGADDFIEKPPDADELYARLRGAERVTLMQRELARLASTDSLTSVLNRRSFFEKAGEACARAGTELPISAILIDIDHFKQINDTFGHGAGDEVIRAVAFEAAKVSRITGRLGGEEFVILLEAEMSCAARMAEALRKTVSGMRIRTGDGVVSLTCSFGVSEWKKGDSIDELLRRADAALYLAKASGRNRVVLEEPGLLMINRDNRQSAIRHLPRTRHTN